MKTWKKADLILWHARSPLNPHCYKHTARGRAQMRFWPKTDAPFDQEASSCRAEQVQKIRLLCLQTKGATEAQDKLTLSNDRHSCDFPIDLCRNEPNQNTEDMTETSFTGHVSYCSMPHWSAPMYYFETHGRKRLFLTQLAWYGLHWDRP